MYVFLVLFLLLPSCLPRDIATMETEFLRTGWGVIFHKVGAILNGISKYLHSFLVNIPDMTYYPLEPMRCDTDDLRLAHCESINKLLKSVNEAYQRDFDEKAAEIASILSIIRSVEESTPEGRKKRRKRSFEDNGAPHLSPSYCEDGGQEGGGGGVLATVGNAMSSIFGTPTWHDIKVVDKHICELANAVEINRQEIVASEKRLSSISQVLNNRITVLQHGLQNMNLRITETQERLVQITREVVGDINEVNKRVTFLESAQEAMYLFLGNFMTFQLAAMQHLNYATNWMLGINRLLEGYIPPELITVSDIQRVLDHVTEVVLPQNPQLRLVHPNPLFYYQIRSTVFARSDNYIFITLTVPLKSVGGILGVYRVDPTHIATVEHHQSSTRIANLPDFFAVTPDLDYYTEMSVTHYSSCRGVNIRVCPTERALQDANKLTCAAAIFFDKKKDVLKHCDIRYEHSDMPTQVVRVRDSEYLVHSKDAGPNTTWSLHCSAPDNHNILRTIDSCNTCIIKMPCGCSLDGGEFLIDFQLTGCEVIDTSGFKTISKAYPVNFSLLTFLYSISSLEEVTAEETHPEPMLESNCFNVNITSEEWEEVVAKDEKYSIDFQRLLKQAHNDSVIYADRASYFLKKATDFSDMKLGPINHLLDNGGDLLGSIFNIHTFVGGMSLFWLVAIASLVLGLYNMCRVHGR